MKKLVGFDNGINLGGWLSQCDHTRERYETFITKDDVKRIASWGKDHVRLPIDYELLQNDDGTIKDNAFEFIDRCYSWCREFNLNILIDLHKTQGYVFDRASTYKSFFTSPVLIEYFKKLWVTIAEHFAADEAVAFELLNEVVNEEDNEPWMQIADETIKLIRKTCPNHKILVGSYQNNSIHTIPCIRDFHDKNIVYNFHCYDPLPVTHQGMHWDKRMSLDFRCKYPISAKELLEKVGKECPELLGAADPLGTENYGPEFFDKMFSEAVAFAEKRDAYLYCGEYGVINKADEETTLNWYNDIHGAFKKYKIGHATWSYKMMDFGLIDDHLKNVLSKIVAY